MSIRYKLVDGISESKHYRNEHVERRSEIQRVYSGVRSNGVTPRIYENIEDILLVSPFIKVNPVFVVNHFCYQIGENRRQDDTDISPVVSVLILIITPEIVNSRR